MALAMYDPSAVIILLAGVIPVEDVAEGTFVEIVKDIQTYTSSKSTDGVITRIKNADNTYTVTLSLTSSSRTNSVLQYMLIADQISGVGMFPILIKDNSGSSLFYSTTCWIEDVPTMQFSDTVEARNWTIKCAEGGVFFGDNYGASSIGEDVFDTLVSAIPVLDGLIRR